MLNIEKYKEELYQLSSLEFAIINNKVCKCGFSTVCERCLFNKGDDCNIERIKWLSQEHKEPILNDEAIAYLKTILEPIRIKNQLTIIRKIFGNSVEQYELLIASHESIILFKYDSKSKMYNFFKDLEINKEYLLEDLGL